MLPDLPRPAIFAHRGASSEAPENTLAAFECALEIGCDGIELDARLCGDDRVVICHDVTLNRTTSGRGRINRMSLEQVQRYDAGSWFDPKFKDQCIPTLDEVFELAGGRTVVNVELKPERGNAAGLAKRVAQQVRRYKLQNSVMVSSFNIQALKEYKKLLPQAFLCLLTLGGILGWRARRFTSQSLPFLSLNPNFRDVSPALISSFPRVIAYTVNRPQDIRRLFGWGIHGIITDEPALAVKLRAEMAL
jgi:glycerophosphoryl diester phosphodiesterase